MNIVLKLLMTVFLANWLFGCALFDGDPNTTIGDTTLGNQQIDVDLGDQKLFGSETAYVIGFTAAQYAVFKNPMLGESVKNKLLSSREDVATFEEKYTAEGASEIVIAALKQRCQFWCNTMAGREYLNKYIVLVDQMVDEAVAGVQVTPTEFLDELLAQIELVESGIVTGE